MASKQVNCYLQPRCLLNPPSAEQTDTRVAHLGCPMYVHEGDLVTSLNSILWSGETAPFEGDKHLPDGLLQGTTKSKAFTLRFFLCCWPPGLAGYPGTRSPQHAFSLIHPLDPVSNLTFVDSREGIKKIGEKGHAFSLAATFSGSKLSS